MNHEPWSAEQANAEIDSRRALLMGLGGLAAGAVLASSRQASAGPLNPPAGPVTSSGPTLQEINGRIALPFGLAEARIPITPNSSATISQPGSYYLTADRQGLTITSPDVTLDLNGFTLSYGNSQAAITLNSARITVRNGRMRPFTLNSGPAIRTTLPNSQIEQITLESLDVTTDTFAIDLLAVNNITINRVTWNCASFEVNTGGIRVGEGALVTNCSGFNGGEGIRVGPGSVVHNCRCAVLTGSNFVLGQSSIATNCVADGGEIGFSLNSSASIECCSAQGHSSRGIVAAGNARISRCQVAGGQRGIELTDGGNRVEHCKIGNAVTGIVSNGIDSIIECSLNASGGGIDDGIRLVGQQSLVDGNYIYAFGSGVRLPAGASTNVVIRNRFVACVFPIAGSGGNMIAPVATSAAAITNPLSNTSI